MNVPQNIILCADDFGLNSGISQGILKLAHLKRLSAVSCMVNQPALRFYASELFALKDNLQIGLHFNLTEGHWVSEPDRPCFTLNELLVKTHLHLIKPALIAKEFNAQLDQYIQALDSLPDFIDGHQHVHQFPVIREVILDIYQQRLKENGTYIRSTWPAFTAPQFKFKAAVLAGTGGGALHRRLKRLAIPHNSFFSGVYDFAPESDYRSLFRKWLAQARNNTLIMCHPGEADSADDVIAHARQHELDYFLSEQYLEDCQEYLVLTASPEMREDVAVHCYESQY